MQEPSNPVDDMENRDSDKPEEQEFSDQRQDGAESTRGSNTVEDQARKGQWPVDRANDQAAVNGMVAPNAMTGAYPVDFSQMMQMMPNGISNPMLNSFPNMLGTYCMPLIVVSLLLMLLCRYAWHWYGSSCNVTSHVSVNVWGIWRTGGGYERHEHGDGVQRRTRRVWWI